MQVPTDPDQLAPKAAAAAGFLRSMASPHRLMLLCHMLDGERSVGELAARVGIGQTLASQHLTRLRAEGYATTRRVGTQIRYRLADPKVAALLGALHGLFCAPDDDPAPDVGTPDDPTPAGDA
jgi:DNA-binding transcriptional ArsR family regulator